MNQIYRCARSTPQAANVADFRGAKNLGELQQILIREDIVRAPILQKYSNFLCKGFNTGRTHLVVQKLGLVRSEARESGSVQQQ